MASPDEATAARVLALRTGLASAERRIEALEAAQQSRAAAASRLAALQPTALRHLLDEAHALADGLARAPPVAMTCARRGGPDGHCELRPADPAALQETLRPIHDVLRRAFALAPDRRAGYEPC